MSNVNGWKSFALCAAIAMIAGCGGGGNGNNSSGNPQMPEPSPPPPAPMQQDFTALVRDIFAATADDSDPVQINDLNLVFADQDNPAAFDDLLE